MLTASSHNALVDYGAMHSEFAVYYIECFFKDRRCFLQLAVDHDQKQDKSYHVAINVGPNDNESASKNIPAKQEEIHHPPDST